MGNPNPLAAVAAGIFMVMAGLVVGGFALEQAWNEQARLAVAARAPGTVTAELNGRPIVAFSLPNGDRVNFTSASAGGNAYPVGSRVEVIYRPDWPSDAVIDRPRARWLRRALLGTAAVALMAFGAYVSWYARRYDLERRP